MEPEEIQTKLNEQIIVKPEDRMEMMKELEADVKQSIWPGPNRLDYFSNKFNPKSFFSYIPERKELWLDLSLVAQKDGEDGWSETPAPTNPIFPRRTQLLANVGKKVHVVEYDFEEAYTELIKILIGMSSEIGVDVIVIPNANKAEEAVAQKMGFSKTTKSVNVPEHITFMNQKFATKSNIECYVWKIEKLQKHGSVKLRKRRRRSK